MNEFLNNNWYWWFVGSFILFISPVFSQTMRKVAKRNDFDGWTIVSLIWPIFVLMFIFEKMDKFIRGSSK